MDPERLQCLTQLANELKPSQVDCILVGIDGRDGSGKTTFADDLARVWSTILSANIIRISLDDFHNPREVRYQRGRTSPEGFYYDSYDYGRFRERVLSPLGSGGDRRYLARSHDLQTDRVLEPGDEPVREAAPGSIVIIDGMFLHRPELDGVWNLSVLLDVSAEVCAERMMLRDGHAPVLDPSDRYFGGQKLYFELCDPRSKATRVIRN